MLIHVYPGPNGLPDITRQAPPPPPRNCPQTDPVSRFLSEAESVTGTVANIMTILG